jgi:hypothetical protein
MSRLEKFPPRRRCGNEDGIQAAFVDWVRTVTASACHVRGAKWWPSVVGGSCKAQMDRHARGRAGSGPHSPRPEFSFALVLHRRAQEHSAGSISAVTC